VLHHRPAKRRIQLTREIFVQDSLVQPQLGVILEYRQELLVAKRRTETLAIVGASVTMDHFHGKMMGLMALAAEAQWFAFKASQTVALLVKGEIQT
jgi:hypothetical protein